MSTQTKRPMTVDAMDAELSMLKETAYSMEQLEAWFSRNTHVFGLTPANGETPVCTVRHDFHKVKWNREEKSATLKVYLDLECRTAARDPYQVGKHFATSQEPSHFAQFAHVLNIDFDLWPCLTVEVLAWHLSKNPNMDKALYQQEEEMLDHFLPKLFPGLSLDKVRSLFIAGILPADELGLVFAETLGPWLMSVRHGKSSPDMSSIDNLAH